MKLNPEMATMLGALGEGALTLFPALLDNGTADLLRRSGYEPDRHGEIYTGIRLVLVCITLILVISLTVGMVHPLVEFVGVPIVGLAVWMLPNFVLSSMVKR